MAQGEYDNEMRGALFVNDRKKKDSHPDRKGTCTIEGVEYWVSGWLKKTRDGKTFLSLAFTRKDDDGTDQRPRGERQQSAGPEDDIAF